MQLSCRHCETDLAIRVVKDASFAAFFTGISHASKIGVVALALSLAAVFTPASAQDLRKGLDAYGRSDYASALVKDTWIQSTIWLDLYEFIVPHCTKNLVS